MTTSDIRKDFPILENLDIAYLDSGATTQKPIQVIEKVEEYYKNLNANPHRGAYDLSILATKVYDESKEKVAKFINAKSISLPMLLCHEDDVNGEHGVSSGKIDTKKLFYIMTKGISYEDARKLIIKANFNNIINEIPDEKLEQEVIEKIEKI